MMQANWDSVATESTFWSSIKSEEKFRREKTVYTKGVFSSENSSASTGKKRGLVYTKKPVSREKKENTYTPKSLQGVCGGPLRAALVYRFWPPTVRVHTPGVMSICGVTCELGKCAHSARRVMVGQPWALSSRSSPQRQRLSHYL